MLEEKLIYDYLLYTLKNTPNNVDNHLIEENKKLKNRIAFSNLKKYIDDYLNDKNKNRFIIMPGLRGLGKTTLLYQLYDYLIANGVDEKNILYLTLDKLQGFLDESSLNAIKTYISQIHRKSISNLDEKLFIFIDEAHYDPNWSLTGKLLFDGSQDKIFTIFTGYSALELEINKDSARRAKKEYIFPLNFNEYLCLKYNYIAPFNLDNALKDLIFNRKIDEAIELESKLNLSLTKENFFICKELEDFLTHGGFPLCLQNNQYETYERILKMIEKIIESDIKKIHSFRNIDSVKKVISYLALEKTNDSSLRKISKVTTESLGTVNEVIDTLKKSQIIFEIKPYGGSKQSKSSKYYFLSPTLKAAINFQLGSYTLEDRSYLGTLAENLVASTFYHDKILYHRPFGLFYDNKVENVDFLLVNVRDDVIPVELGIDKKDKKQVKKAMNSYDSDYGIVVSNKTSFIQEDDDVIFIPLKTFSFI